MKADGKQRTPREQGNDMIYICARCNNKGELRHGKRSGNNLAKSETMLKQVRSSFLKQCPRLCPDCLKELLDFVQYRK